MTAGTPTSDLGEAGAREGSGLARAAVGGVAWQGLSYVGGKILVLATTVVLARLLTPGDFGVVGLALVFIAYAEVVTDLGVAQALIYLPEDRDANDLAFTVTLVFSLFLVGVAMAAAPAVAEFFRRPDLTPLFRVLSLSLLVGGIGQVPDALLRKRLLFRRRLIADILRACGQGVVSITLAAAGAGPWAIVLGYLAGGVLWSGTAWALVAYRPGSGFWRVRVAKARPLLSYGLATAGNALLLSLVFDIDYLIVGRQLGASALGHYTLGFRIPEMVIINVFYVLSAVAFPLFSMAREDRGLLRRGYVATIRLQTVYGVMAGVGLAAVAPMLVHVVFGARWSQSIVPVTGNRGSRRVQGHRPPGPGGGAFVRAIGRAGTRAAGSGAVRDRRRLMDAGRRGVRSRHPDAGGGFARPRPVSPIGGRRPRSGPGGRSRGGRRGPGGATVDAGSRIRSPCPGDRGGRHRGRCRPACR